MPDFNPSPEHISQIFRLGIPKAFHDLDANHQFFLLSQENSSKHNALMIAVIEQPGSVRHIVNVMDKLDPIGKATILTHKESNKCNALMVAVLLQPSVVPSILELMKTLNPKDKTDILTQKVRNGLNVLAIAAALEPAAVPAILEFMDQLDPEDKATILAQTQAALENSNALLRAVQNRPHTVPGILKLMEGLNNTQKVNLFSQEDSDGSNALVLAARYHPSVVPSILEFMKTLDPKDKAAILTQKGWMGWSALMTAARFSPKAVRDILQFMDQLDNTQRTNILTQKSPGYNYDALQLAIQYKPSVVPSILKVINQTIDNKRAKYRLIGQYSWSFYENDVMKAAYADAIWERDCERLLEELKPKGAEEIEGLPEQKLYNSLNSAFNTYCRSSKSPQDLATFHEAWNDTITAARESEELKSNTAVFEVIKTIALVISCIGLIYLAYQAQQRSEKGRSLFFPSSLEKTLNDLEDIKELAHASGENVAGPLSNESERPPPYAPHPTEPLPLTDGDTQPFAYGLSASRNSFFSNPPPAPSEQTEPSNSTTPSAPPELRVK